MGTSSGYSYRDKKANDPQFQISKEDNFTFKYSKTTQSINIRNGYRKLIGYIHYSSSNNTKFSLRLPFNQGECYCGSLSNYKSLDELINTPKNGLKDIFGIDIPEKILNQFIYGNMIDIKYLK